MPDERDLSHARFKQASTEAANRAEATALLIRCGYRVYRPEADIEGEDMVVREPDLRFYSVQLKPRPYVDRERYHGRDLKMLFPIGPFTPDRPRSWFLVLHDPLFGWVENNHGRSPKWDGRWHTPAPSKALRVFLESYEIRPPAEPVPSGEGDSEISN